MSVYSSNTSSHKAFFLSLLKGVAILSIVEVPIYALHVVIALNYSTILENILLLVVMIGAVQVWSTSRSYPAKVQMCTSLEALPAG